LSGGGRDDCGVHNGHDAQETVPFVDPDLLDTRRKQRQQLASIPDWIIEEGRGFPALYPEGEVALPAQPALVELRLRRSAQVHLDHLAGLLEHGNRLSAAAATKQFLTDWTQASPSTNGSSTPMDGLLQDAIDAAEREESEQHAVVEHIADDMTPDAWRAVVLLALADVLADDGYRDPRLR
jgi:hypothetical protein